MTLRIRFTPTGLAEKMVELKAGKDFVFYLDMCKARGWNYQFLLDDIEMNEWEARAYIYRS